MKVSILIPVFNEERTISQLIEKILSINLKKELIIINDGSTDNTLLEIQKFSKKIDKIISHNKNLGKGAAIKTGKKFIKGDIVIIQDGDLEYDPNDYKFLIKPILENQAEVVYGSRVLGKSRYLRNDFTSIFRTFANHVLTIISNFINRQKLTDAHTCYKVFKADTFKLIDLEEDDFSFCPEVTTKLSNLKIDIMEVPINYKGRKINEGKKIRFYDAIKALIVLFKYKFF
jgi:dolichol-phosphate mannosyltransferase